VPEATEQSAKQSLENISKKASLSKEKTREVVREVSKQTENEEVAKEVAAKEQTTTEEVKRVGKKVFSAVGEEPPVQPGKPDKPPVSIEEYEEMRRMWIEHYRKGEVPVSEKIKDRAAWVSEESVKLENVLNKIASANEDIRAEGLKQVADVIPFFILGDMDIEDIAVYLRAKLTAAKDVAQSLKAEEGVKKRLEEHTEYVEVDRQQKAEKAQVLEQKLETPQTSPREPSPPLAE
jgi:hypothetical protein